MTVQRERETHLRIFVESLSAVQLILLRKLLGTDLFNTTQRRWITEAVGDLKRGGSHHDWLARVDGSVPSVFDDPAAIARGQGR